MSHVPGTENLSREEEDALLYGRMHPLPRLTNTPKKNDDIYEVVVIGAGPAGLFLTLNLAHLGLLDSSLLCVDAKARATPAGHADGLNGRTLEIFRLARIEGEILRDATGISGYSSWSRPNGDPNDFTRDASQNMTSVAPARYGDLKLMHQGRLERIFSRDLSEYSSRGVSYSTRFVDLSIDEKDTEHPITVVLEKDGQQRTIRTKYLVAADGARSSIRQKLNIGQEGQNLPRVWGVIDIICDTDFPDIRKVTQLPGNLGEGRGHGFIIPREMMSNGEWITRFYVDLTDYSESTEGMSDTRAFRESITMDIIMEKVREKLHPYRVDLKKGTKPIWWAAYPIAQKNAKQQIVRDTSGHPRIFLAGDSMHSHSPSQGLGMNMGMQDAFNLAWKLAHALHALTPSPTALLDSYENERRPVARRLVHLDRVWNSTGKTEQPIEERISDMAEFLTCCGIEYAPGLLVRRPGEPPVEAGSGEEQAGREAEGTHIPPPREDTQGIVKGTAFLQGILRPGRRLLNMSLTRFADGNAWDLHDDLRANGRWRVVVLAAREFPAGATGRAVEYVCGTTVKGYVGGMVEGIIVYPGRQEGRDSFTWEKVPACVKEHAEMRVYSAAEEAYATYGVDVERGAVVVVRPDGVVGAVVGLNDVAALDEFLGRVLVKAHVNGLENRQSGLGAECAMPAGHKEYR